MFIGGSASTFKRLGLPLDNKRNDGETQWFKVVVRVILLFTSLYY